MLWTGQLLTCACAVYGSLIDDIVNAIKNAADCGTCHALLAPLKVLAIGGDSAFSSVITELCKVVKVVDDDVCDGIVAQQGPIIAHDLRSISVLGQTATKLCDSVFGLCQPPDVNEFAVPFPKPAPANPKVWTSKGNAVFQVAHFSDVHIDREYAPGSDVNCTKPICCRNYADSAHPPKMAAGPIGAHNCDTSTPLAQSMLNAIPPTTKFSLFTGDVVEASVWLVNQTGVTNDMKTFNSEMSALLKTPVYPAIGNHEIAPVNDFPRTTADDPNAAQWVFDTQSAGWTEWINTTAANQVSHNSGSYAIVHPGTDLRIISMNTVYWYKANFRLYDNDDQQPDPNGILAFAVEQLQAAEDAGQRAWIMGHMPAGRSDVLNDQSNYFDQVVQRYKNTIAAQFYGHSHQDQFEVAYSDYTNRNAQTAVSIAYIAPSLTPRDGNPAFKIYDVDPDTYEIMDSRVYYSDMSSPNFQTSPSWQLYYSARETYGPLAGLEATNSLTPPFWHRVTEAFENNSTAFDLYNAFLNRGFAVPVCDTDCKALAICGLRAMRSQDNCQVSKPGSNFRKRSEGTGGVTHPDECEGAGINTIFSQLPSLLSESSTDLDELKRAITKSFVV